ncbi:cupin domain-containing protein [Aliiglaciecola sp. M165]|uniref:cupin domain-containing protein n=1 Tax=Aliiglaciecola sp. M165 TaxID=2593649 RepID=UPI001C8F20BC|nr:cupin domain-containing protein [Aliiglaciecola sp. M165]
MYHITLKHKKAFIEEHWQKKPVVIRNAFLNFQDPIDENELAGLSQEEGIDSRIISEISGDWSLHHGPFEDFNEVCQGAWTLLVQGVDNYIEAAKSLLDAFDFVPSWRVDDVMVSFSNEGAGVGPHLDQYDVFIVQGKGSRRWQVGSRGDYTETFPCCGLRQISNFEPIIDEVLEPGDLIYIPPGFPHNGIALEPCLNYSIGFRAPTQQELLGRFADFADEKGLFTSRYCDPDLLPRESREIMYQTEIQKFKQLFIQMIDSPHFAQFIGQCFTALPTQNDYSFELNEQYSPNQIEKMLDNGMLLERSLSLRKLLLKNEIDDDFQWDMWINGHLIQVSDEQLVLLQKLLECDVIDKNTKINYENSLFFNQLMSKLVITGAFFPV